MAEIVISEFMEPGAVEELPSEFAVACDLALGVRPVGFDQLLRGGVVDEAALASALRRGHLAGAALDVFGREPLPGDNPFAGLTNVGLTPHVASVTAEADLRVSRLIADNVRGRLRNHAT